LYEPQFGSVFIDGKNVKEYNLRELRKHIGVVSQEPILWSLTIKQNILMGLAIIEESISEKRLIEVCQMARCHDFIMQLPKAYDTPAGKTVYKALSLAFYRSSHT